MAERHSTYCPTCGYAYGHNSGSSQTRIDWVIVGGESGPDARPCTLANVRWIVGQCRTSLVPCFVKQLGARPRMTKAEWEAFALRDSWQGCDDGTNYGIATLCDAKKGGMIDEWPEDLRVRQFPGHDFAELCT
jgi:hypothetical protein